MDQNGIGGVEAKADIVARAAAGLGARIRHVYRVECFDPDGKIKWEEIVRNIVVDEGCNEILDKFYKGSSYTAAHYVGLIGAGAGTVAETSGANSVTGSGTSFQAADVNSDILIVGAGASGADLATTVASRSSTTAINTTANAGTTVSGASYAIEPRPADTMASKSFNETTPYSNANRPSFTPGTVASKSVDNSASKAVFNINASGRVFGAFLSTNNTKGGTTGLLIGGGLFAASRAVENGDTLNVTVTATQNSA